jgi:hypothetical protein
VCGEVRPRTVYKPDSVMGVILICLYSPLRRYYMQTETEAARRCRHLIDESSVFVSWS